MSHNVFFFCFLRLALDGERIQRGTGERGGPPGDGEGRGQDPVGRSGYEHLRDAPGDRSGESFFCRAISRQLARHQFLLFFYLFKDYTQETYVLLAEYDENGVLVIPDQVHATGITFFFSTPPPLRSPPMKARSKHLYSYPQVFTVLNQAGFGSVNVGELVQVHRNRKDLGEGGGGETP